MRVSITCIGFVPHTKNKQQPKQARLLDCCPTYNTKINIIMGTVHGVYLKYVGLSALSYVGYTILAREKFANGSSNDSSCTTGTTSYIIVPMMEMSQRLLKQLYPLLLNTFASITASSTTDHITSLRDLNNITSSSASTTTSILLFQTIPACILGYSTLLNGIIAILFKCEIGMKFIGKNQVNGQIPIWSYILFFPFHIPTKIYTYLHSLQDRNKHIPMASEIIPGWYLGGCYGHLLTSSSTSTSIDSNNTTNEQDQPMEWLAVIDLTVEFPESTIHHTKQYLSMPTWDGIPASPQQLEDGANFILHALQSNKNNSTSNNILIHCAHGRGRSTTMMCAALVKCGYYTTWEDAFNIGIKPKRSVCKLNTRMKQNLIQWQNIYVKNEPKKGQ
jgi:protein-tyrosine phosphatase